MAIKVNKGASKKITESFKSIDVDGGGTLGKEDFDQNGEMEGTSIHLTKTRDMS